MPIMSEGALKPKTAALYARFSCSKQREASIEDQLNECRRWCRRNGYAIVAEYADYAMSGRTDDRPDFQRMIANAGESDIVLVYMMDRFSRDPFDAPIYKRELSKKGVRLVSAIEAIPDSPEGIIYEKLLEGLAACESRKTSLRTLRGMRGNAEKCLTNGVRCFGYRTGPDGRYEVVPEEAKIVREVFLRRIDRESVNSIAADLRRRGVRSRAGNPVKDTFVQNMLHNEKYLGIYSWGGYREEGGMPQIVDEVTFARAQLVRSAKRREDEDWGTFVLSGRVLCGKCGRAMAGTSGRGKSGRKYEYYSCRQCGEAKPVRRDWLEGSIVSHLHSVLSDRDEALRIAAACFEGMFDDAGRSDREDAEKALREAESGLRNILNAIEQGIIAPGVKERIAQLEAQRDDARRTLASLDESGMSVDDFADFLQFGATLDDQNLLDAFVYQVMVFDDEVVVTLNFDTEQNEPARVNLSRVRTVEQWCPVGTERRTLLTCIGGTFFIRYKRAA